MRTSEPTRCVPTELSVTSSPAVTTPATSTGAPVEPEAALAFSRTPPAALTSATFTVAPLRLSEPLWAVTSPAVKSPETARLRLRPAVSA